MTRESAVSLGGALLLLLAAEGAAAQSSHPPPQADIDRSVDAGAKFLLEAWAREPNEPAYKGDTLVFYALLAAGRGNEPRTGKLLQRILATPLDGTDFPVYDVGLRAMALAHADPVRYQTEIARCAWWLVNAQTDNGQWDYDGPQDGEVPKKFDTVPWSGPVPTGKNATGRTGLKVERRAKWVAANPRREGILRNASTTQYGLLGLFAARSAFIIVPEETWKKAEEMLLRTQDGKEGGWAYIDPKDKSNQWQPVDPPSHLDHTLMILSCLSILKRVRERASPEIDKAADRAFHYLTRRADWLGEYLRTMPQDKDGGLTLIYHFYDLYSIERVGIFWDRDKLGGMAWYALGARQLLQKQTGDGSWGLNYRDGSSDKLVNTSFAILFLKRTVAGMPTPTQGNKPRPDVPTGK